MGRPRKLAPADPSDPIYQPTLPGTAVPRFVGPVESAAEVAVAAAGELLGDSDAAAVALLRSVARAVDLAELAGERAQQVSAVARMSDLLTKLRLEPSAREGGGTGDSWAAALSSLGVPTFGDGTES